MTEERQPKRRRRRGRRGGARRGRDGAPEQPRGEQRSAQATAEREPPSRLRRDRDQPARRWRWRTFPVFVAFVAGAFLMLLIAPEPNTTLYTVLFFAFLGAAAFAGAHYLTQIFVARRRR